MSKTPAELLDSARDHLLYALLGDSVPASTAHSLVAAFQDAVERSAASDIRHEAEHGYNRTIFNTPSTRAGMRQAADLIDPDRGD